MTPETAPVREDDPFADIPAGKALILFDGVCNLCNQFVRHVHANDPDGRFLFASQQSELGRRFTAKLGMPADEPASVILIRDGRHWLRSQAAFCVLADLKGPTRLLSVFRYLPRVVGDWGYDLVAKYRYRLFGKKDVCEMPAAGLRARFMPQGWA